MFPFNFRFVFEVTSENLETSRTDVSASISIESKATRIALQFTIFNDCIRQLQVCVTIVIQLRNEN